LTSLGLMTFWLMVFGLMTMSVKER